MKPMKRWMTQLALAVALVAALPGGAGAQAADTTLAQRYATLHAAQPKLPAREAARTLGVAEVDLLALQLGAGVTRLRDGAEAARDIMQRALDLGEVMALTRNDNGVLERTGVATRLAPAPAPTDLAPDKVKEREQRMRNIAGGYLGGPIDLRFTFKDWLYAFAVVKPGRDGKPSRSLQFFDTHGNGVHQIYLRNEAGTAAFDQLVADFRADGQSAVLPVTAAAIPLPRPDSTIDVAQFRLAWNDMTDVHEFSRILTEFGVTREQALRLAPPGATRPLAPAAVRMLLQQAAEQQLALMAFVGNGAVTQIYTGKIHKVQEAGGWFNVLDPAFNLHLRDTAFQRGWVVQRGAITSVEFYDQAGQLVVTFFGAHERGQPPAAAWSALARQLPGAES